MNKKHKQKIEKIIEGNIFITGKKTGFIRQPEKDIEIQERNLNTALHNDLVKVLITGEGRHSQAKIIEIIERAKTKFVGTAVRDNDGIFLIPDNSKFYPRLTIQSPTAPEIKLPDNENIKVLVELLPWTNAKKNPEGKILKILGKKGEHETEIKSILYEQGFESDFPVTVEKEALKISEQARQDFENEISKRRDFRGVTTFTIDPDDAKDFDDALSVKKLPNGDTEIGVHIADVSHFVQINSPIDREATERCTSVYLVDRTIPMLPEVLSNNLCSLNPDEDKLTYSAVFILDKNARVKERWFGETVIHSDKRFSYKEAQKVLDTGGGEFYEELNTLNNLALIMRTERTQQGAISFGSNEYKFILNADGKPTAVSKKELLATMELIEDFMLLANKEVAEYIDREQKIRKVVMPFVYRIHDQPKPDQIKELKEFLKTIGYHLPLKNGLVSSQDLNALLEKIENEPEGNLIATAVLKSMAKAIYSVNNIGHYGLAFKHYTHFTSPIRRYPDIMTHRLMKKYLLNSKLSIRSKQKYKELTARSTAQEIAATQAERSSVKYKFVEFMSEKIGEEFAGIISGITKWGVYVQIENGAEGMISVRSLKDDYYELDTKKYCLIGQKTRNTYRLGDEIKVCLVKTDLDQKTIDFELLAD
ncbi:MAG: ribonuclease R [Patescibacteria group bacterium]